MNGEIIKVHHRPTGLEGVLIKYCEANFGQGRLCHVRTLEGFNYYALVNDFIVLR